MFDCHTLVPGGIQVLIADDHAAVRHASAMCVAVYDDLCLAGEATNGEETIRLCACTQPDVVLLDVTLPDMTGAVATRAIHKVCPGISVIAMCTFQEEGLGVEALRAGAAGYLLKNVSADQLARAIRLSYKDRSGLQTRLPLA